MSLNFPINKTYRLFTVICLQSEVLFITLRKRKTMWTDLSCLQPQKKMLKPFSAML